MRARLIPVLLAVCVAAGACSNGAKVAATSPAPATPSGSATPSVNPDFGYGDTILMTDTGFEPKNLLANPGMTITWENQTDHVWTVVFDHQNVHSKAIPAGATFTWTSPRPVSVTYHDANHGSYTGSITVQG